MGLKQDATKVFNQKYKSHEKSDEYELMSEIKILKAKAMFKHIPCGTVFEDTPFLFLFSQHQDRCPYCNPPKKRSKRTVEDVKSDFNALVKDKFELIKVEKEIAREGVYLMHINYKCSECGEKGEVLHRNLNNGVKCRHCGNKAEGKTSRELLSERTKLISDEIISK